MTEKEFYDKDYDFKSITIDKRFKQAWKETIYVLLTWSLSAFLLIVLMFTLGKGNPTEYTYLFGHPLWFTCTMLALFACLGIAVIITKTLFQDMELGETDPTNIIPITATKEEA